MNDSAQARDLLIELTEKGHRVPFKLTGRSMLPLIAPGDLILLEKADPASLGLGELVVFETDEGFSAHRIVRRRQTREGWQLQTACQKARILDPWIPATRIMGRAVEIEGACPNNTRRPAPSGWRAALWARSIRILCKLHDLRARLSRSDFR